MKKKLLCLILIHAALLKGFNTSSGRDEISKINLSTPIRVLLDRAGQDVTVKSIVNDMYVKDGEGGGWIKFGKEVHVKLSPKTRSLVINDIPFSGIGVYLRGGPHPLDKLQYQTDIYRGALKATVTEQGILVTNVLPLEDYLHGMLAGEMSPSWEMEALKAQAVASRTYALYMNAHPKHALYDLEKGTADQVYMGADGESVRVRQAVESTRGQILSLHNKPIKSYYHSRCGGTTETAETVWKFNAKGNQIRVPCPYCQKFPYMWKSLVKAVELFRSLGIPFSEQSPFRLSLADRSPSGRIASVKFESGGKEKKINSDELRSALGYTRLKSTRFDWKISGTEIAFEGTGAGHGVGMCQWGARFLAQQRKTYKEILAHYYPGASFQLQSTGLK